MAAPRPEKVARVASDEQFTDYCDKVEIPRFFNSFSRISLVTPLGVKLCRPSEVVLDLLPQPQRGEFRKEDGELVVDSGGNRVS